MKHKWTKKEDGTVDEWAWENGFHNGPVCEICGVCPCVICTPDYDEEECSGEPCEPKATQADRIRAMSDEELAELLCTADWCDQCDQVKEDGTCHAMALDGPLNQYCAAGALKWLRQPAKGEG